MNKNIKFNIFEEKEMRTKGFSDYNKKKWSYWTIISPGISFNISIDKETKEGNIDVLFEDFCQPYDYQKELYKNRFNVYALSIHDKVQEEMRKFLKNKIVENYTMGDYI